MKKLIFTLITLSFLTSCSAMQGTIENNRYVSSNREFSAAMPRLPMVKVKDGHNGPLYFAEFVPDHDYWMMGGAYSVEWFKLRKKPDDVLLKLLAKRMYDTVPNISQPTCYFTTLQGKRAYQCTATGVKDNIATVLLGTSVVMNNHYINVFYLCPTEFKLDNNGYNQFLNSMTLSPQSQNEL